MNRICPRCFNRTMHEGVCFSCGYYITSERNPIVLPEFTVLKKRYTVGTTLGIGGFGITYSAWDNYEGKKKAIKEFFPNSHANRDTNEKNVIPIAGESDVFSNGLEKFSKEASILMDIGGIASVVKVEDFFQENGTAYMVMEYVDGVSLRSVCKTDGGQVSMDKAGAVFIALARTLEKIHAYKLLHRDVSPDNIMMLPNGSVKLIDFGAARYVSGHAAKLTVVLKPGFAPIEQYSSKGEQGAWTDIYGLACCMYWYISGIKVPDALERQKGKDVEPLCEIRSDVSQNFSDVIQKAMMLDKNQRYQSVSAMLKDLDVQARTVPLDETCVENKKKLFGKHNEQQQFFAQLIGGPFDGYLFPFPDDNQLVVGRSPAYCNAVMPSVDVISRKHCTIELVPDQEYMIITDHSTCGTFIYHGTRLSKEVPTPLGINEEFWIANPQYKIKIIAIDK